MNIGAYRVVFKRPDSIRFWSDRCSSMLDGLNDSLEYGCSSEFLFQVFMLVVFLTDVVLDIGRSKAKLGFLTRGFKDNGIAR